MNARKINPYPVPGEDSIRRALLDTELFVSGEERLREDGAQRFRACKAFSVLAEALAAGNRDPEPAGRCRAAAKRILAGGVCTPRFAGREDTVSDCCLVYGLALLRSMEGGPSILDGTDEERLKVFFKAALVSAAYTLCDYDECGRSRPLCRESMSGEENCWNGLRIDQWESGLVILYAAALALGRGYLAEFPKTYDHMRFLGELEAQGFGAIRKCFEGVRRTPGTDGRAEEPAAKARRVEAMLKRWSFKRVTLAEAAENPMKLYGTTQRLCWDRIAQDGDYMGELGMAHAFDCYDMCPGDTCGCRQDAGYFCACLSPILQGRALMHWLGSWELPENRGVRENVERLHRVGVSDYYAKAVNGYYSQSALYSKTESLTQDRYLLDELRSMGLLREAVFHDTFDYDARGLLLEHWRPSGDGYGIRRDVVRPYNRKPILTTRPGAEFTDRDERVLVLDGTNGAELLVTRQSFREVRMTVWARSEGEGEIGIAGGWRDDRNYWLLSYADGWLTVKQVKDGTAAAKARKPFCLTAGVPCRLEGIFAERSVCFAVNGVPELRSPADGCAPGAVGLLADGTVFCFDGVLVQRL